MTREEAIQVLQTALTAPFIYGAYANALKMAIKALSADIQIDEDTISRAEAIDAIVMELDAIDHVPKWVFDRLTDKLNKVPPATTPIKCIAEIKIDTDEVVQEIKNLVDELSEEWEEIGTFKDKNDVTIHVLHCQKCGALHRARKLYTGEYVNANFCPNCGTKMGGVRNDD